MTNGFLEADVRTCFTVGTWLFLRKLPDIVKLYVGIGSGMI